MTSSRLMGAASAALTLIMIVIYLLVIHAQGNQPAVWFIIALAVATALTAYGSVAARGRRPALIVAAVLLGASGLLGILSVGVPILVAAALAIAAAARAGSPGHVDNARVAP